MEEELLIASSSVDGGIGCWDLRNGAENIRFKTCASPFHGLTSIGKRFLASSQIRESKSTGSILYWSWSKPQVEVQSFPEEPIKPLVANDEGTYLVGGGVSGNIYLWEVASGRLLAKWRAHYRAVTCLVFTEDNSFLISGSEDGGVKVWSLLLILDDYQREQTSQLHEHSFCEHTLRVTDIVTGYGGGNAIIVSASEDRTCKVWSLSKGIRLRSVLFPSIIDSIALDPGEHVFYAGGRDGKIYIAALNADSSTSKSHYSHIIGSFSSNSKAVTCLAYGTNSNVLVAGSEDGMIRVWDPRSHNIVRMFKHAKGPVNNICVIRLPVNLNFQGLSKMQVSSKKQGSLLPPPLHKYLNSIDESTGFNAIITLHDISHSSVDTSYTSSQVMESQIKELKKEGTSAAVEMEVERLKLESAKRNENFQKLITMYKKLHEAYVASILDGDNVGSTNRI